MNACKLLLTLLTGASLAMSASAQEKPLTLRIAASYAGTDSIMGAAQQSLIARIKSLAGQTMTVQLIAPGALVGTDKLLNAVANDSIAAAFVDPANWAAKDPAFFIYSDASLPGASGFDKLSWVLSAQGKTQFKDLHAAHNVEALVCGATLQSAGIWMRRPVEELGGFKDLKIHAQGLSAKVLQTLGAKTKKIARPSELARSLELKVIDAVYLPGKPFDEQVELMAKSAPYYYAGGLGQHVALRSLIVSRKLWESISASQRAILESACNDLTLQMVARSKDRLNRSVAAYKKAKVNTYPWSEQLRKEIVGAWNTVAGEFAGNSEPFKKAWDNLNQYLSGGRAFRAISR